MHCIHPDWLMSCNRLAATAIEGMNIGIKRNKMAPSILACDAPVSAKRKPATKKYTKVNRIKYQNSDLDALPSNLAYLPKQIFNDSVNPIIDFIASFNTKIYS